MSKIIANAFELNIKASASKQNAFVDVEKGFWAADFINALYYNGIATDSGNKFKPNDEINRGQFSAFLSRSLSDDFKIPENTLGTPIAKGVVTASSLNIRTGPSASTASVGSISLGGIVDVHEMNGYWMKINYNGKTGYVHKTHLKFKNISGTSVKNRVIGIDAGHGGTDPGASGGGINEANITLDVAKGVAAKLQNDGAKVIMTRQTDVYPSLQDRVDISKTNHSELFVSIHVIGNPNSQANGSETCYSQGFNDNSAESIV
jgi:N-acetylmuramoyl-L-alanine amidase